MIYVFSLVAGRHRWVMWLFLSLRWMVLAAIGSPVVLLSGIAWLAGFHFFILPIGVIIHVALLAKLDVYSRHRKVLLLKRKWPVLWAQVQRKQILDLDDGHLNRPWMAAPKLGVLYKVSGESVSLSARPAVGQTLVDLQEQASVIAAQTSLVDSFEIECLKASSHRGQLKIMFTDGLLTVKNATTKETSHA